MHHPPSPKIAKKSDVLYGCSQILFKYVQLFKAVKINKTSLTYNFTIVIFSTYTNGLRGHKRQERKPIN